MSKDTVLVDLQASPSIHTMAIHKTGIEDLKFPIQFDDLKQKQSITALFELSVGLKPEERGTHMSRFVEYLQNHNGIFTLQGFKDAVLEVKELLGSSTAFITAEFDYFLHKNAPVSGISAYMDYILKIETKVDDSDVVTQIMHIDIPLTSLCPCSKGISEYGAHNQRSVVSISLLSKKPIAPHKIITLVEGCGSSQLYGILKRTDEKYVTEYAYDHPKFAEDLVRDVAVKICENKEISKYKVKTKNFESIHNHNAYALITNFSTE